MLRHEIMNTVWPCADRPADERILRLQVEDVVLVDARRHDQQRPPVDARASSARTGSARSARCGRRRCRASPRGCGRPRTRSASLIEMRPLRASAARLARPCTRLAPSVASARFSTSGFVAAKLVGASASTYCCVRNASRRFSGSGSAAQRRELVQVFAGEQVALLHQREVRQLVPLARGEAAVARRGARRPPAIGCPAASVGRKRRPPQPPTAPRSAGAYFSLRAASASASGRPSGPIGSDSGDDRDAAQCACAYAAGARAGPPLRPFLGRGLPVRGSFDGDGAASRAGEASCEIAYTGIARLSRARRTSSCGSCRRVSARARRARTR